MGTMRLYLRPQPCDWNGRDDGRPGPKNLRNDRGQPGVYERPEPFVALFEDERSLDDLVETRLPDVRPELRITFNDLPVPKRSLRPDLIRPVLAATELRGSCAITYQSMTSADSIERIICPHALIKASGRWHVRAFDFARRRFVDFSLSRVLASNELPAQATVPAELDDHWHAIIDVEFTPHPDLSPQQRKAVAREYGMSGMTLTIPVRRALLFYLLGETRLLNAVRTADKAEAHGLGLWLRDARFVADELAKMNFEE